MFSPIALREAVLANLAPPPPPPPAPPPPPRGLLVGLDGNRPLVIPTETWFSTHKHVMGASNFGKSYLLFNLIAQEVDESSGVCFLDPHGSGFWMTLAYCAREGIDPSRLLIIDPSWDKVTTKLSPLPASAALAVDAIMRTAGERSLENTMLFGKNVTALAHAFEEAGYPLAFMRDFCMADDEGEAFRTRVLSKVTDLFCLREWVAFSRMSDRDKRMELSSLVNRLAPFLRDPRVNRMMTFAKGNVDWAEVMDSKKIVLVNLSPGRGKPLDTQSRDLIGTLVMLGIREAAFRRQNDHPFAVYVDEAGSFINDDFADNLDELRKFGVYLTLSHQRMEQIESVSKNVMSSILTNCKIRLVMGGCNRPDTERLLGEMYTGFMPLEEVKYESSAVAFWPVLKREQVRAVAEGKGFSEGSGSAHVVGSGISSGSVFVPDGPLALLGIGDGHGIHDSEGESSHLADSQTYFSSSSYSRVESVADVPFYDQQPFFQEANKTFYSLEEQREKKLHLLMNQPVRSVAVKLHGQVVRFVQTVTVEEKPPVDVDAYATKVWDACPYTVSNVMPVSVTAPPPEHEVEALPPPHSVESEGQSKAADLSRVGLEPVPAEPGQDSSRPDTPYPAADRSPSAPAAGGLVKRKRGRPRKHPLPEPLGSLETNDLRPDDLDAL